MYEFICEHCGMTVLRKKKGRFCSPRCSGLASHGRPKVQVDMSYDWIYLGDGRYKCRYQEGVSCRDRNCKKCGWNPAVARARTKEILRKGITHGV